VRLFVALAFALPAAAQAQQMVRLEVRPHLGDTLRLHLEQHVEMTATSRVGSRDSSIVSMTSMDVFARAIVQSSDARGTLLLAITDSVLVSANGDILSEELDASRRAMQGSKIMMRIMPDGSSQIVSDPGGVATKLAAFMGRMPAVLPQRPVAVGGSWSRVMPVPMEDRAGVSHTASLSTTFHLDSISQRSDIAFITLAGELTHDPKSDPHDPADDYPMSGVISGNMQMDRARGWLTDSRAQITLSTTMPAAEGSKGVPVRVTLKITQRMRASGRR
jgi:hypothetical protein